MKSRIIILTILLSSYSVSTVFSQKKALNTITESDLEAHLEFIASDLLEGRETGDPGLVIASQYIQSNIKRIGLKSMNNNSSYLQDMDMLWITSDFENTWLKGINDQSELVFRNDSVICPIPYFLNTELEGEVVFAGYGYRNDEEDYNDFEGLDLNGKIVMIMSRTPKNFRDKSEDVTTFFNERKEGPKFIHALQNGAKAILWVFDPDNIYESFYEFGDLSYFDNTFFLADEAPQASPASFVFITRHTADLILKSTGYTLAELQHQIDSENKPVSQPVNGINLNIKLEKKVKDFTSYNVVGIIEGSDPVLKNECVVYTAHYDHAGLDGKGNVFNGADDNGSGTVGLLEIAEAYMSLSKPPKRSIVFVWCTAEEKGLYGSKYYTMHPAYPLEQTVININLDMIGRIKTEADTGKVLFYDIDVKGKDGLFVYTGKQSSDLIHINETACQKLDLIADYDGEQTHLYSSDQYHFYENGIPVLFYHTGIHTDLHQITDEVSKISYAKMKRVCQLAFSVGYEAANRSKRIEVDNPIDSEE